MKEENEDLKAKVTKLDEEVSRLAVLLHERCVEVADYKQEIQRLRGIIDTHCELHEMMLLNATRDAEEIKELEAEVEALREDI